ncbi:MAG TPA: cell division protein FtsA [Candidatus Eisenbergiella merdipullorum]|uniref:Cell division protein FtsA n=1 Tax=Candidatus Eisenbergiella merdipullorum TaxID=2838553 RepID=A0A9D2I5N9_9FIRM|nr:cell division protein FtsA [Candidatus Eisenbergiella merdipullorum]
MSKTDSQERGYGKEEKELLFALDIGTRSLVGVAGRLEENKVRVLAMEIQPHNRRAMRDGQIEDIREVARQAVVVKERLEAKLGVPLKNVYVAAAGRALKTCQASFELKMEQRVRIDEEVVSRLEAGAISLAEETFRSQEGEQEKFFLVGYSVSQYLLEGYPMTSLLDHSGKEMCADIIATFLPEQVVESLYSAMRMAGLSIAGLTLEPIAAINIAIPEKIRLLNLVLVDIGAGTSDIASCRNGSVTGYTMATVAGDEITEALMQEYLLDFDTAEAVKTEAGICDEVSFRDILGNIRKVPSSDIFQAVDGVSDELSGEIAEKIVQVNGGCPSAVFLAGGGSKLKGLREKIAQRLGMEENRVAVAGDFFQMNCISEENINDPEYATPLGILVSAGLGLIHDNYRIMLNHSPARLFGNGNLTVRDVLLMNGYTYRDMVGSSGRNLVITVNGQRKVFSGSVAVPAVIMINGKETSLTSRIHPGDAIWFVPARSGENASLSAAQALGLSENDRVLLNGKEQDASVMLHSGDVLAELAAAPKTEENRKEEMQIWLNNEAVSLQPKADGQPYYLMDMLPRVDIDFQKIKHPVQLLVNGEESGFRRLLKAGDRVVIRETEE